jgi:Arc/MetJ-type ribon-helix-helix transcriptional regulator
MAKASLHEIAVDGIDGDPDNYPLGEPPRFDFPMRVRQLAAEAASIILGRTIPEEAVVWNRRLINRVYGWVYRHGVAPGGNADIEITAANRDDFLAPIRTETGSGPMNTTRDRRRPATPTAAQINVRVDADLAERIDELVAAGVADSRPAALRSALTLFIDQHERDQIAASIVDGYRRIPQSDDDAIWPTEASIQMIKEEPW